MTIIDFRNDFLAEVETRLSAVDVDAATDEQLLAAAALYKMASAVGTEDFLGLSALRKLETLNGAQLETWLGDMSNRAAFYQVVDNAAVMASIASNSTVMTAIAGSGHALNAIITSANGIAAVAANPAAWTTFKAGTGLSAASIPTMTSDTAPSGVAFSSTTYGGGQEAFRAFDKTTTHWLSANASVTNQYVGYAFSAPVYIHTLEIDNTQWGSTVDAKNVRFEYSDDGVSWTVAIPQTILPSNTSGIIFPVVVSKRHKYWRLYILDNYGSASYVGIREIQLTGFQ